MSSVRTLDVSHLKPYDVSNQAPVWWGQVVLAIIEGMMFSILLVAFLYTRLRLDVWPPPGDQYPHTLLPTLTLLLLILSCIPAYYGDEAAKKNDRRGMLVGLGLNFLLASGAFALRVVEWHSFNYNWKADAYGSYMWAFLGLHSFDFLADLGFTLVLLVIVACNRCGPKQRIGVHVDTVVWYFVVLIWIPIYVVIYWGPHFLATQQ